MEQNLVSRKNVVYFGWKLVWDVENQMILLILWEIWKIGTVLLAIVTKLTF